MQRYNLDLEKKQTEKDSEVAALKKRNAELVKKTRKLEKEAR
jgi:hypothetical protein